MAWTVKRMSEEIKTDNKKKDNTRDREMAELAAFMPDDSAGLMALAFISVTEFHEAVLSGDVDKAAAVSARYDATIWKLNGGTFFGSVADEQAAGSMIERHCRAVPGKVPMWGQRGEFIIITGEVRALVEYSQVGRIGAHFAFHAVDLDSPFISETGYKSHFDNIRGGCSVDEAATSIFADYIKEKRYNIKADNRNRLARQVLPDWMADLAARRAPATPIVPQGFVLVDVILPSHQAFIVRKWAELAQTRTKVAPMDQVDARDETEGFRVGQRCQIISMHHPVFAKEIGKVVIVTKVNPANRSVWAHDDKPTKFRINRNGRQVIEYDPRCIQSGYGFDQLRILE
ncbi:MAG: klcB [Methylobacter sp.]